MEAGTMVPASFLYMIDGCGLTPWRAGTLVGEKSGRSGSCSKAIREAKAGDRAHSTGFLMKTRFRHPQLPHGLWKLPLVSSHV